MIIKSIIFGMHLYLHQYKMENENGEFVKDATTQIKNRKQPTNDFQHSE